MEKCQSLFSKKNIKYYHKVLSADFVIRLKQKQQAVRNPDIENNVKNIGTQRLRSESYSRGNSAHDYGTSFPTSFHHLST